MKTEYILKTGDHAILRTFCGSFSDMDHLYEELHAESRPFARPAVNIAETASEYMLELALPGYRKSDLHLVIEDDVLIIEAVASCPGHYHEVLHFYKREFVMESFARSFLLPEDVDTASASYEGGILFIHLVKGAVKVLQECGACHRETIQIQ